MYYSTTLINGHIAHHIRENLKLLWVGQFWPNKNLSGRRYSAWNIVSAEALIFLHDVQIPVESQQ